MLTALLRRKIVYKMIAHCSKAGARQFGSRTVLGAGTPAPPVQVPQIEPRHSGPTDAALPQDNVTCSPDGE